ncbi:ENTH domain-containing protein [Colletotrichum tofieldiae]|uniref:ENTH domain-containing protein n=1 Tax=Colletotrichum tofieldiae TaxID=708197 RepID=A0A166VEB3_9PEZI|nr:ENTH domain-containing protein [Colletotrichum tofieldiae]GKT65853.1 ENTH domain-containing protein [Colletotrichum tofieldiae]GKT70967.1 ENTH domain-containing protein [Colletotrichum tofieldiae]
MSKVMRSVKNVTKGYSSVQVKVREATSNDPWGPTGTQMSEIAQLTYNTSTEFYEIMDMLDKRLNDKGKNWRHVLKALKVLDYCLHEGSELVVTWARQSIYIIKTLREFQYVDEDGRDVGQNVRVAAKELTALILDEERLRAERSDRKSWKSRVTGLEEFAPQHTSPTQPRVRRRMSNEDDAEYRLAIEASKHQEEEDRRKRASRAAHETEDDDLAKAIKLSKEEDERRRREAEDNNASLLFDDTPVQTTQPQYTGFNQGYQQGSAVDFFANPIDQNQLQPQPTGFMPNAYTGYQQPQATGFPNGYGSGGFGMQHNMTDPYGQQQQGFQPQPTGYNPYAQAQVQSPAPQEPVAQPGSNNPWSTGSMKQGNPMKPMQTGSNNPFASSFGRPQPQSQPSMPALGALPEQKTLSTFSQPSYGQSSYSQPSFNQPQAASNQGTNAFGTPQKELTEHEAKLNALLAGGDGMDTFGNTGQTRIPAQHTAPGTFVNSAGTGAQRLTAEATGNNPFLRSQYTGMPNISYGGAQMPAATGPAGINGSNNPFAATRPQQQNTQPQDLIQF